MRGDAILFKTIVPCSLSLKEETLLQKWRQEWPVHPEEFIKREKMYGLEIPSEYGGIGGSEYFHSRWLQYVATRDKEANWVHRIMVPNSLGPAQLILKYGSPQQKDKYLEKLSKGDYIPCFGLTGPWNGSDAGAIPDYGEWKDGGIEFSCEKRWITLSPIANLLGIAIRMKEGITLIMVDLTELSEKERSKIKIRRHDPIGSQFPNGAISIDKLWIPISQVIGEKDGVGRGWIMLMECLQHGRGISLPSVCLGGNKDVMWHTTWYTRTREQFGKRLIQFQAIEELQAEMMIRTWIGHVLNEFYHASQTHSSSFSAAMKWILTTFHRDVVIMSMDIFAGKGITLGPKNPIAHYYQQLPVPITVEGSNILTSNVIIPIQTIFEHHPYFHQLTEALEKNDAVLFYKTISNICGHLMDNSIKSTILHHREQRHISQQILLTYFALLHGKSLRQDQRLTEKWAMRWMQIICHSALLWHYQHSSYSSVNHALYLICDEWLEGYFRKNVQKPTKFLKSDQVTFIANVLATEPSILELFERDLYIHKESPFQRVRDEYMKDPKCILSKELKQKVIEVDSV